MNSLYSSKPLKLTLQGKQSRLANLSSRVMTAFSDVRALATPLVWFDNAARSYKNEPL